MDLHDRYKIAYDMARKAIVEKVRGEHLRVATNLDSLRIVIDELEKYREGENPVCDSWTWLDNLRVLKEYLQIYKLSDIDSLKTQRNSYNHLDEKYKQLDQNLECIIRNNGVFEPLINLPILEEQNELVSEHLEEKEDISPRVSSENESTPTGLETFEQRAREQLSRMNEAYNKICTQVEEMERQRAVTSKSDIAGIRRLINQSFFLQQKLAYLNKRRTKRVEVLDGDHSKNLSDFEEPDDFPKHGPGKLRSKNMVNPSMTAEEKHTLELITRIRDQDFEPAPGTEPVVKGKNKTYTYNWTPVDDCFEHIRVKYEPRLNRIIFDRVFREALGNPERTQIGSRRFQGGVLTDKKRIFYVQWRICV